MYRSFYTLVLRLAAPLIWLGMVRRAQRAGGKWDIFSAQRFGFGYGSLRAACAQAPVWVHAVSLGETRAAQPLIQGLIDRGLPVLLTHTTSTGRVEGARRFELAIAQGQVRQVWFPYDFPGAVRRFLAAFEPRCGLLVEREIWPNLLAAARHQKVPMALVSGRLSEASLRQGRWLGKALRQALSGLDVVLAQTEGDAVRLRQAGARAPQIVGNLKFDLVLPDAPLQAAKVWRAAVARPVVVIASTREGEDALFVAALRQRASPSDTALYLLIPRHPQRFDEVARMLKVAGLRFVRRSQLSDKVAADILVVLGDTLGEMPFYYGAADVAIVAGSFAPLGGHNFIEACAAGVPVIVGPHTFNFAQAVQDAVAAGATLRVATAEEAVEVAHTLLGDTSRRRAMQAAAHRWMAEHTGATARTLAALEHLLA
jgi:3-deoxy-D-manno-octulosonic-acid transferase